MFILDCRVGHLHSHLLELKKIISARPKGGLGSVNSKKEKQCTRLLPIHHYWPMVDKPH